MSHPRWPRGFLGSGSELRDFLLMVRDQAFLTSSGRWQFVSCGDFTRLLDEDRRPRPADPASLVRLCKQLLDLHLAGGEAEVMEVMGRAGCWGGQLAVEYDAYLERRLI